METALLIARLLLALVFAVAGLAKLADRAGTRQAVADFGLPSSLGGPLGLLLPLAEIAVAVALLPSGSAWWAAVAGVVLLGVFLGAIAVNLARGRKPDCRCFGQVHSAPAGWSSLARNAALGGVAGLVVWRGGDDPGPSAVAWLGDLGALEAVALAGGVLALGLFVTGAALLVNLMRQNGRLLIRVEALEQSLGAGDTPVAVEDVPQPGLPVGTPAPRFALAGVHGETLTLDALRAAGKPVLLILTDPDCGPCNALTPEIGRWQREHAGELTIAVISRGTAEANRAKSAEHGLANVLVQQAREVSDPYQEEGTPSAVLVQPDGTIGSPLAAGADQIGALIARTVGTPAQPTAVAAPAPPAAPAPAPAAQAPSSNGSGAPAGPRIGDAAPPLRLADVKGRRVNLAGFRGTRTLVLFWNPGCGYCQQMLDDLRAWDEDPPEGAPKLLVVATGDEEQIGAMGLRSKVLLDPDFTVAHSFGANGTPMGVLVDEQGRIASEVAAGKDAVMALARGEPIPEPQAAPTPEAPQPGEPAPALRLPDPDGRPVDLEDFRGRQAVLLFWNPGCGFCQQMLDDLRAFDATPPPGAPKRLVIFTGSAEEARAMGLRSPVVLDPSFAVAHTFGANGTPMAVLVDERGNIASEIAVGGPAVLELARTGASTAETSTG